MYCNVIYLIVYSLPKCVYRTFVKTKGMSEIKRRLLHVSVVATVDHLNHLHLSDCRKTR